MSVDERDGRATDGRQGVQRTPRSNGRTTGGAPGDGRRSRAGRTGADLVGAAGSDGGARGARRHPTLGTAALKVSALTEEATAPVRVGEVAGPQLRVAPPAPVSVPRAPFVAVVIVIVVAGLFGILLINTKTNENSFRIATLQSEKSKLDNQKQELDRQIAAFENPGNLDATARMLGLVKSDPPAYIRLPDGKVIGVPKPGTGQPAITAQLPAAQPGTAQLPAAQPGTAQQSGAGAQSRNGSDVGAAPVTGR